MSFETSSNDRQGDPYETLGVDRRAGDAEIKRAYFRLVRDHPPEQDPDRFRAVRSAYDRVRTEDRRRQVNLFLLQPAPPLAARRGPAYDLSLHAGDVIALAIEMVAAQFPAALDYREPKVPD